MILFHTRVLEKDHNTQYNVDRKLFVIGELELVTTPEQHTHTLLISSTESLCPQFTSFSAAIIIIHSNSTPLDHWSAPMRFCELSVNVLSTAEPIWTDSSTKRDWVWSPQKFDLLFLQRATTSETEFFLPRLGLGHARPLSFYGFSRCAERFRSLGPSLLPGPLWGDKELSLWERPATTSAGEGMANQNALCTCKTGGAFRWTIGNGIWLALTICSLTHRVATLIAESQCHTAEHTNPELLLRINRWPVRSGNFAKSYFLRKKREFLNPFSCVRREGKPTICTVVLPNQCWNSKSQRGLYYFGAPTTLSSCGYWSKTKLKGTVP